MQFCDSVAGGAFGGNRGVKPVPPEKGVFPLDRMHLCGPVHHFLKMFGLLSFIF